MLVAHFFSISAVCGEECKREGKSKNNSSKKETAESQASSEKWFDFFIFIR
jgi:hypothetical protein